MKVPLKSAHNLQSNLRFPTNTLITSAKGEPVSRMWAEVCTGRKNYSKEPDHQFHSTVAPPHHPKKAANAHVARDQVDSPHSGPSASLCRGKTDKLTMDHGPPVWLINQVEARLEGCDSALLLG